MIHRASVAIKREEIIGNLSSGLGNLEINYFPLVFAFHSLDGRVKSDPDAGPSRVTLF